MLLKVFLVVYNGLRIVARTKGHENKVRSGASNSKITLCGRSKLSGILGICLWLYNMMAARAERCPIL